MCYCCACLGPRIRNSVLELLSLIKENDKLLKSYLLDFFVENHWSSVPNKWRNALGKLSPEELGQWILYPEPFKSYKEVWPLSLLALRSAVGHLSLERQPSEDKRFLSPSGFCSKCPHAEFLKDDQEPISAFDSKLYSKHIKPKKLHEIEIIAKVAQKSASRSGCHFIIDIGSGLGHLGRILALHHGLRVCCLEEQSCLVEKARKIDEQLVKTLRKTGLVPPVHINMSIKAALNQKELLQVLKSAFSIVEGQEFKFGLVGLHPCGDLGPYLMRLLVNCPEACFVNLVGCCYMKLTDDNAVSSFNGYPMSDFVLQSPANSLSYEAKEVCCHALEMYCERLKKGCVDDLKVHCYRSAAECIIVKNWPHLKHSGLRSIKNVQNMSFAQYANLAVDRLGITLPQEELNTQEVQSRLEQWMHVVIYYSLRLLLAPTVESAILLDRLLFFEERGICSLLIPAFDPLFSPRNHILIGFKNKSI